MRILRPIVAFVCLLQVQISFCWTIPNEERGLHTSSRRVASSSSNKSIPDSKDQQSPHLVFPGGGIFFYWQAGAVQYLREQGYDLSRVSFSGASAGALTATLTASNVDFYDATKLALDMSEEAGIWERRAGLQGIWGPIIETWLDELLPNNAVETVEGRLSVLVTPVPTFGKSRIETFADKNDLIRCNMASVHIPWFLNGELTCAFRNKHHIDGSFLATHKDYVPPERDKQPIILSWQQDPAMEGRALEFVQALSKDSIWSILEQGKKYARQMDKEGRFESLLL